MKSWEFPYYYLISSKIWSKFISIYLQRFFLRFELYVDKMVSLRSSFCLTFFFIFFYGDKMFFSETFLDKLTFLTALRSLSFSSFSTHSYSCSIVLSLLCILFIYYMALLYIDFFLTSSNSWHSKALIFSGSKKALVKSSKNITSVFLAVYDRMKPGHHG